MSFHSRIEGERISADATRHLLRLDPSKYARGLVSFTPSANLLGDMVAKAGAFVQKPASYEAVMRVFRYNPDTIIAIAKGQWRQKSGMAPVGFWAHIPLNQAGHDALFSGEFDTTDPKLHFIAAASEKPAAVYHWYTFMPAQLGGGFALALERFALPRYKNVPMYCYAANAQARAFFLRSGWKEGSEHNGRYLEKLLHLQPPELVESTPLYASYIAGAGSKRLGIRIGTGVDDLLLAISIRGAAFVGERFLPVHEDIDGNDMSSTHVIGYVGDNPAGTIRIRYFANFVKLERLAVLPQHRGDKLASALVKAALAFVQRKGYRRVYGQAAEPFLPFWKKHGFRQRIGTGITYLTDEVYYEIDLELDAPADAITPESGAKILVRQEGLWHQPGAFEEG
ncbi:GNAT family N-acetyltransferase [Bosea sp. ASV33]|uniref:GNAT family N-acetyltransferase n=1 Tax=Bosea sp. ASV33 TaxID=2795106 RepID=UPI0018ECBFC7|nr:GNAT family N-acetyltransferase [Bosea sp. ASV33]